MFGLDACARDKSVFALLLFCLGGRWPLPSGVLWRTFSLNKSPELIDESWG